jgi:hypothetical protein
MGSSPPPGPFPPVRSPFPAPPPALVGALLMIAARLAPGLFRMTTHRWWRETLRLEVGGFLLDIPVFPVRVIELLDFDSSS